MIMLWMCFIKYDLEMCNDCLTVEEIGAMVRDGEDYYCEQCDRFKNRLVDEEGNRLCVMCGKVLDDHDHDNSCVECE
jgi:hypothetical protein